MKFPYKHRKGGALRSSAASLALFGLMSASVATAFAAPLTYPQVFSPGWNLAGNSLTAPIDVKTAFGASASVQTVWKWDAAGSKWAFYAPSLDAAGTLASYVASKDYSLLSTIAPGEGYWVNINGVAPLDRGTQSGEGFSLTAQKLVKGWNLGATGDESNATTLANALGNVTTLWSWDNPSNSWFFHAPALAASNELAAYIQSKGYKSFGASTLGKGLGFWINYAGASTGGTNGDTGAVTASVCARIVCGAGATPGGIAPALPATMPTTSRLSGGNPAADIAAAWAAAAPDMKARFFGAPPPAALAQINVQFYPTTPSLTPQYNVTELDAAKKPIGRTAIYRFGTDAKPLTADDVMTSHNINYTYGNNVSDGVQFVGAGADGVWRTADDVTVNASQAIYGIFGIGGISGKGHRIVVPALAAGTDKVFFTADDTVGSTGWDLVTLNANGFGVQSVHYSSAGTDGKFFTADDVINGYTVFNVDINGNALQAVTYNSAGVDKTWFTSDDVVQSVTAGVVGNNRLSHLATFGKGADNAWFTADDIVGSWQYFAYDAAGKLQLTATHSAKGADGVWFTADDTATATTTLYDAAGRAAQVATATGIGADGKWFTGDDTMSGYTLSSWNASGQQQTLSAGFSGKGPDGLWFTADDVPGTQYWIRDYNADGAMLQQTNFSGVGADGKPFTADDVASYTINRYLNGAPAGGVAMSNKGPDGVAFTADDVANGYSDSTLNAAGLLTKNFTRKGPGADGIWFNADDPVTYLIVNSYDAQNRPSGQMAYSAAGADGVWETADDVVASTATYTHDSAGNKTYVYRDSAGAISSWMSGKVSNGGLTVDWVTYSGAGADGVWQTADDVVSYVSHNESDASGRALVAGYGAVGKDGVWFTADDYATYQKFSYDAQGKTAIVATYSGAGPDGVWFSADDVLDNAAYSYLPWPVK